MGLRRFGRPKNNGESSSNFYVANCGPAVGLSYEDIASVFCKFGNLIGVYAADESGTVVIVSYSEVSSAQSALDALHGRPCPQLGGRSLHIRYSVIQPNPQDQVKDLVHVSVTDSDLNIPGIYLVHDFVSAKEEEELLQAVDSRPWNCLAKGNLIDFSTKLQIHDLLMPCRILEVLKVAGFKEVNEKTNLTKKEENREEMEMKERNQRRLKASNPKLSFKQKGRSSNRLFIMEMEERRREL